MDTAYTGELKQKLKLIELYLYRFESIVQHIIHQNNGKQVYLFSNNAIDDGILIARKYL